MEPINKDKVCKRYDESFKRSAVDLLLSSGRSAKQIAAELGVSPWNLRDWKERFAPKAPVPARTPAELEAQVRQLQKELLRVQTQRDILKKNFGHPLHTERQRFQRMKELSSQFAIARLCETLEVSRSGYYAWLKAGARPRQVANARLAREIENIFEQHQENYGSRRITAVLRGKGMVCNHKRVERLMRAEGLRARRPKRFRLRTTQSDHHHPIAPNHLPEKKITAPNQAWAADITYVETDEGWLYLAGVLDLYSRRLVGWAMEDHLQSSLPLSALRMALQQRQPGAGLLHHSDRGVQYASGDYRKNLLAFGVEASMSRKGNCYDNAAMESFWSTLKNEMIHRIKYRTRAQARRSIFAWIETYYNRVRLHSSIGYKSPVDFENQLN